MNQQDLASTSEISIDPVPKVRGLSVILWPNHGLTVPSPIREGFG